MASYHRIAFRVKKKKKKERKKEKKRKQSNFHFLQAKKEIKENEKNHANYRLKILMRISDPL